MEQERRLQPEQVPQRAKTVDELYEFEGFYRAPGVCRVRIYEGAEETTPVVILTELPDNLSTSVTNMIECLTPEVVRKHFPQRFEYDDPAIVLEHYQQPARSRTGKKLKFEYDRVSFDSWTPRVKWDGGFERVAIGEPEWRPMTPAILSEIVGDQVAEEIMREGEMDAPRPAEPAGLA